MYDETHLPAARRIDARNKNLPVSEFEQVGEGPRSGRRGEAFRTKYDRLSRLFEGPGHRKVVADCSFPGLQNLYIVKGLFADRRSASPAEISAGFSKHGRDCRIPCRSKCARYRISARTTRNNPAIRRRRTDPRILQRRDQFVQPTTRKANVGISEREHFEFVGGQGAHGSLQIVDFFAAIGWRPGNNDMHGVRTGGLYALDYLYRRIETRRYREIDFVIRVVEPRQGHKVFFEAALVAFTRTDQRGRWRIEPRMRAKPLTNHSKPDKPVPKRIRTQGDLRDDQDVEEDLHWREINKISQ